MGDGALGEGEQAAGLRRDEEFPWQPLLEDKVALQIPQAPFPWTLKPDVKKAEML